MFRPNTGRKTLDRRPVSESTSSTTPADADEASAGSGNRPRRPVASGVVNPKLLYSLDAFLACTGMSASAYHNALSAGLKTHRCGKRTFIEGRDFLEFLRAQRKEGSGQG